MEQNPHQPLPVRESRAPPPCASAAGTGHPHRQRVAETPAVAAAAYSSDAQTAWAAHRREIPSAWAAGGQRNPTEEEEWDPRGGGSPPGAECP
jgi:hypothetical protein